MARRQRSGHELEHACGDVNMRNIVGPAVVATMIAGSASASDCLKAKAEACGYYEWVVVKSIADFRAAVAVCVESSRDTTDKYGLDTGAEYYKACRASLQGMVDYTNDRRLEYDGCVSKFVC